MARPEKIKTPLGQRLSDVRKALGHDSRKSFAELLGMSADTLGTYERGVSEPNMALLADYNRKYAVNLTWLVTGFGDMFDDPSKAPAEAVSDVAEPAMARLARLVDQFYSEEARRKLPGIDVTSEATLLYNELRRRGTNAHNLEEVEAMVPVLRLHLKRRLEQAAADPHTDKRRA